ncbi:heme exporter protein CcmD [Halomonas nitroreducens]|uniref:Heme exporter protein D n=2 Tax=Halomonas nitroreducens TaxID=447425 RepID=A0A431UYK5_9GAMM|nr:heme exporter protein CcmD [Halomonas nitroreducens]RTQ98579.1 heme exporter protein CcmD [Halomonas nitroreducens]
MAFESLTAFLAMGGHGPYVWAAYGATVVLLLGVTLHARAERRRVLRDLRRRVRRERRQAAPTPVSPDKRHARES